MEARVLRGTCAVPASKSLALRYLLAASLASGKTRLFGLDPPGEESRDVRAARELLLACGIECGEREKGMLAIEGRPPLSGGWQPREPLELRESGALARMATAVLGLAHGWTGAGTGETATFELRASGSLRARPSPGLFDLLSRAGAVVEHLEGESLWPVRLRPGRAPRRLDLERARSSQELSGLLLAASALPEPREIHCGSVPSLPYVEMTRQVLAVFGASIDHDRKLGVWQVRGPLRAPDEPLRVEPDASAAAVALAAGCVSGGEVEVEGLAADSLQGDVRIAEYLQSMGCEIAWTASGVRAGGLPRRPIDVDLSGEPDLAPVLAACAGTLALRAARGFTRARESRSSLRGLSSLVYKESNRLLGLEEGLQALGLQSRVEGASLSIEPGTAASPVQGTIVLDPRGDHRMAFAFALLALARGEVEIQGADCVEKSWPGFWSSLDRLSVPPGVGSQAPCPQTPPPRDLF